MGCFKTVILDIGHCGVFEITYFVYCDLYFATIMCMSLSFISPMMHLYILLMGCMCNYPKSSESLGHCQHSLDDL